MSELSAALKNYIDLEKFLFQADEQAKSIQTKYEEALRENGINGIYTADEATKVWLAYKAIENHNEEIVRAKEKMNQNEEIIKKYLTPLKGRSVSYMFQLPDRILHQSKTYVFSLLDSGLTHNQKQ